jgi:hypothetical protein
LRLVAIFGGRQKLKIAENPDFMSIIGDADERLRMKENPSVAEFFSACSLLSKEILTCSNASLWMGASRW